MNKRLFTLTISALFVVLIVIFLPVVNEEISGKTEIQNNTKISNNKNKNTNIKFSRVIHEDMTKEEEYLIEKIDDALDNDDTVELIKIEPLVLNSTKEVKLEYIEALGWFGEDTIHELKKYFKSKDEDISKLAVETWVSSLDEVEDDNLKSVFIRNTVEELYDEDIIEEIIMSIDNSENEIVILKTLVEIIENCKNKIAVSVAKEHYEFTTDEEYVDVETAEKWLKENIEIDEDEYQ